MLRASKGRTGKSSAEYYSMTSTAVFDPKTIRMLSMRRKYPVLLLEPSTLPRRQPVYRHVPTLLPNNG